MFWERFRTLCTEAGKTPNAVARELGLSSATTSQWKRRGSSPSAKTLAKLSAYFGVSADDLISEEDRPLVTREKGTKIGVLSSVGAGIPLEAIQDILDYEELPAHMALGGHEYFGLCVSGHSMEPDYRPGDVIILRRQDTCQSGQDCAVMVNGDDATFKRVRISPDGLTLQPLNPSFDPIHFTHDEVRDRPVRILGVVVELRRRI